jgi:aldose 1-epimerase
LTHSDHQPPTPNPVSSQPWGSAHGRPVTLYTLRNARGTLVKVSDYGLIISELHVADRYGRLGNVVLGFDNLDQYLAGHPYFGATVGRVANRVARGRFSLDGREYTLAVNNGPNHLHGGLKGFDKRVWDATVLPSAGGEQAIRFHRLSPDGEEGYPGNLDVTVTYTLTDADELRLDYRATTDRPTPVNLTNHSYFNLTGSGDTLATELWVDADRFTPTDGTLIPTGELRPVRGTPLDFTIAKPTGRDLAQLQPFPGGYDHNLVLNSGGGDLALAARAHDPASGRVLELLTTQPGLQLYNGILLDGSLVGAGGVRYDQFAGFCLETQHFPDAINHPDFPSVVLRPGETFQSTTVLRFRAK